MRPLLRGMLIGVVLTALASLGNHWANNVQWENEAFIRGYGGFTFKSNDPLNRLWFHWNRKPTIPNS